MVSKGIVVKGAINTTIEDCHVEGYDVAYEIEDSVETRMARNVAISKEEIVLQRLKGMDLRFSGFTLDHIEEAKSKIRRNGRKGFSDSFIGRVAAGALGGSAASVIGPMIVSLL
ncbi:hypothetical protein GCM10011360_10100 [Primorskyibacter flagellatus]|uniref:Uncharacterized protein n=1 Tax=Primorskyibacter flagellatus TaxID=1387277 RepID=A0A917EDT5_9RHOB|nr:hypothetical protein [Primorskyibacter flagellatus]GGE23495.1 hypothetical protein GCM10011360_10100 [Primorskyibacter flagellatus]